MNVPVYNTSSNNKNYYNTKSGTPLSQSTHGVKKELHQGDILINRLFDLKKIISGWNKTHNTRVLLQCTFTVQYTCISIYIIKAPYDDLSISGT